MRIQSQQASFQTTNSSKRTKGFPWFNVSISILLAIFIIFIIFYLFRLNKQQKLLVQKIEKQLNQKQLIAGQINKLNDLQSYNDQRFKILNSKIHNIPIRNLQKPLEQDFSNFYCLKQPLIPNFLPSKGQREFLINTRYGFQIYGDSGDGKVQYLSRMIMSQGTFEPDQINLLGRLLRPGYKFLNIGSQSGMEAIIAAKIVSQKGHVYIFQPSNFSNFLVKKNFKHNNLTDRVDIYRLAASDVKRSGILYIDKTNTGGNSLIQGLQVFQNRNQIQKQQVQLDLVDNILPSNVLIDLALIDVQCHEVQVLFGMKKLLKRSPYMIILLEWAYLRNKQKNQLKTSQILNYLIQLGYEFYYGVGFDPVKCIVGKYIKITEPLNELLTVDYANIMIVPQNVILP